MEFEETVIQKTERHSRSGRISDRISIGKDIQVRVNDVSKVKRWEAL